MTPNKSLECGRERQGAFSLHRRAARSAQALGRMNPWASVVAHRYLGLGAFADATIGVLAGTVAVLLNRLELGYWGEFTLVIFLLPTASAWLIASLTREAEKRWPRRRTWGRYSYRGDNSTDAA